MSPWMTGLCLTGGLAWVGTQTKFGLFPGLPFFPRVSDDWLGSLSDAKRVMKGTGWEFWGTGRHSWRQSSALWLRDLGRIVYHSSESLGLIGLDL